MTNSNQNTIKETLADKLSFTSIRTKSDWKQKRISPRCWWSVSPTGDYGKDCRTGNKLAIEYLEYENAADGSGVLQSIVMDMPREDKRTGIEIAFLSLIALSITGATVLRAKAIVAYWDDCEKSAA